MRLISRNDLVQTYLLYFEYEASSGNLFKSLVATRMGVI